MSPAGFVAGGCGETGCGEVSGTGSDAVQATAPHPRTPATSVRRSNRGPCSIRTARVSRSMRRSAKRPCNSVSEALCRTLSVVLHNARPEADGRWVWHWDPAFVQGKFGSVDETRSLGNAPLLTDAVASLRVPVLLVRGRSSDLLSEEGARDFMALAPHAEFADVAGAGHMVAGDRNEVFNRAILDFLERHRPA